MQTKWHQPLSPHVVNLKRASHSLNQLPSQAAVGGVSVLCYKHLPGDKAHCCILWPCARRGQKFGTKFGRMSHHLTQSRLCFHLNHQIDTLTWQIIYWLWKQLCTKKKKTVTSTRTHCAQDPFSLSFKVINIIPFGLLLHYIVAFEVLKKHQCSLKWISSSRSKLYSNPWFE